MDHSHSRFARGAQDSRGTFDKGVLRLGVNRDDSVLAVHGEESGVSGVEQGDVPCASVSWGSKERSTWRLTTKTVVPDRGGGIQVGVIEQEGYGFKHVD